MTEKKIDRRIQRTRKLLLNALVELILEKGYKKITVQNIIDRADVGRSTFYAHFPDKDALLEYGFVDLAHDFHQQASNKVDAPEEQHMIDSLLFFQHAYANRALYLAIVGSGGRDLILDIGHRHMQLNIQSHLGELGKDGAAQHIPAPVISNYLAGALQSLLIWWLENDMPYSPKEINSMFMRLAMPGVREIFS